MNSTWDEATLPDVAEIVSGVHVEADKVTQEPAGDPYLTGPEDFNGFSFDVSKYTREATKYCKDGDTLVTVKGSGCGSSSFATQRAAISRQLKSLRAENILHPLFLFYVIRSKEDKLAALAEGSAIPGLSNGHLRALTVPRPPLEEQRKITSILYTVDELLDTLQEYLQKVERLKRGVRERLLSQGLYDHQLSEIRVGPKPIQIPASWEVCTLDDINDDDRPICYGVLKPGPDVEEGTPLIKIEDLVNGNINPEQTFHRIGEELDDEFARSRLEGNEVLISIQGTVGKVAVVPDTMNGANISRTVGRITPVEIEPYWIKYWLESNAIQDYMSVIASGSTRASYNIGDLRETVIAVPPRAERREIVRILKEFDELLLDGDQRGSQLVRLKRGLMQDLLTGEVRTKDVEIEIPEEVAAYG